MKSCREKNTDFFQTVAVVANVDETFTRMRSQTEFPDVIVLGDLGKKKKNKKNFSSTLKYQTLVEDSFFVS